MHGHTSDMDWVLKEAMKHRKKRVYDSKETIEEQPRETAVTTCEHKVEDNLGKLQETVINVVNVVNNLSFEECMTRRVAKMMRNNEWYN